MGVAVAFADSNAEAGAALAPFTQSSAPPGSPSLPRTAAADAFRRALRQHRRLLPGGAPYLGETFWSPEAGAADRRPARRCDAARAVTTIARHDRRRPASSEVAALSLPGTVFAACYAVWKEAAGDAANGNWHRGAVSSLERLAIGHYVGETDLNVATRAERSYT
mgnify:CR=1 FL=1